MSLGTAIFLSAALLGLIALYAVTKDRWRWARIAKWGLVAPVVAIVAIALGAWAYSAYEGRPTAQEEFEGLRLGATPADVRFLKGEPIKGESTDNFWIYDARATNAGPSGAIVFVVFQDSEVRYIGYGEKDSWVSTSLLGFRVGAEYAAVIKKLGPPDHSFASADGSARVLSFEKYQAFFEFERGQVTTFGIYDPSKGPVNPFSKKSGPPRSVASP